MRRSAKRTWLVIVAFIQMISFSLLSYEFPINGWKEKPPAELGVNVNKLDELRELVGGNGCVIKNGYLIYKWGDISKSQDIASAFKPILTTLLFVALQEGKISSIDEPIYKYEPRLKGLNDGKDEGITWRHLAMQTSGYGLKEPPGKAYSYNDYALALYYDTLMEKVFKEVGTSVFKTRLAEPLGFEDKYTFAAFGSKDRLGRLAISVRDFARFGLLILNNGNWNGRQIIDEKYVKLMLNSPLPPDFPLTSGEFAQMINGQRTIGGTRNITAVGPGYYSFNWWLNKTNSKEQRLIMDAPPDTVVASGHGGKRMLWIIPSFDIIVCWNDTRVEDHDISPGNRNTLLNKSARLIASAVQSSDFVAKKTVLGIKGSQFTINGTPTFLLGISYYGALGPPEQIIKNDLNKMQEHGFNWIRVWATWSAFNKDVSAVTSDGAPREPFISKLKWLVNECDKRGMIVDVTFSRGNGITGEPRLQKLEHHLNAVKTVIAALKEYKNWYIDLSNERNIKDKRFTSLNDLAKLRAYGRELYPELLVTASYVGDIDETELKQYLNYVKVDFITPHRPRNSSSVDQTKQKTQQYLEFMKKLGKITPVHYQEPFRRNFGNWEPKAEDFIKDLQSAIGGGAAGWCFHQGDNRSRKDGIPRRSFDLTERSLFDQLDQEEIQFLKLLKKLNINKLQK